jgi:hypothetical protein
VSGPAHPRLAVLYPHDLIGENAGLLDLHVRPLKELLEPLGWIIDARSVLGPGFAGSALGADLAVIQMLAAPEVEAVIRRRRELGRPTIFEITDNPLGVGDWLPSAASVHSPLARQGLLYHAYLSDALQMLVPALAELFASVNPRTIVLSPYVPIPPEVPAKPSGFVFGWSGSRSHAESLALAAPVVIEFCRRHPDARFAFMGDREMFDELFGAIAPEQTDVHPFSDQAGHLGFVGRLHVGLAPMAATPFNATRADTRVCIYAGHGVAAVLEDAPAHRPHRAHARIYATGQELLATLEELYDDREQVSDLARRAREWVVRERSPAALGAQRDRAYRELLAAAQNSRPADPMPARDEAQLAARLAGARRCEPEEAVARCLELVAEAPGYEQAHLLAVQGLEKLGRDEEALEHAGRLRPSPVYADLFAEVQARIARRVRPDQQRQHVESIDSPFRRARLMAGGSPAARSRAVLEHQPYDHFALASTIQRMRREEPASPELAELYERACLVAPEQVPPDRRPSRLAPFLPA